MEKTSKQVSLVVQPRPRINEVGAQPASSPSPSHLQHEIVIPGTQSPRNDTVVLLHGRGDNATGIAPLAFELNREDLRVISVQAPLTLDPPHDGGYEWYRMHEAGQTEQPTLLESLTALEAFLESTGQKSSDNGDRVVLMGFSQGAVAALGIQAQRPDLVAGVIAISGYFPLKTEDLATNLNGAKIFLGHGTSDTVVPVTLGRQSLKILEELSAAVTYREYPIGHQISMDELKDIRVWLDETLPRPKKS